MEKLHYGKKKLLCIAQSTYTSIKLEVWEWISLFYWNIYIYLYNQYIVFKFNQYLVYLWYSWSNIRDFCITFAPEQPIWPRNECLKEMKKLVIFFRDNFLLFRFGFDFVRFIFLFSSSFIENRKCIYLGCSTWYLMYISLNNYHDQGN